MIVVRNLSSYSGDDALALTLGNFDGVHAGHRAIIDKLCLMAKQKGLKTGVLTFSPHPQKFFNKDLRLLATERKKIETFENLGVDYLFIMNFDENVANIDPEIFAREILAKKLRSCFVIVGHDYRFGKNRKGTFEVLKQLGEKYGFSAVKVGKVEIDGRTVSSTNIRKALTEGDLDTAAEMLTEPFSLEGVVVKGDGIATKLGFPTANIFIKNELIPHAGVYAAKTVIDGIEHNSAVYIGKRPTFDTDGSVRVETHIFDFDENIYGKFIEIKLIKHMRKDKKFDNKEDLAVQIGRDIKDTEKYLKGLK